MAHKIKITIDSTNRGIRDDIQITEGNGKEAMVLDLEEFASLYDFLHNQPLINEVARKISDAYHNLNKTSIWFDMGGEGFNFRCLHSMDKVVKTLIKNFGFLNGNMYYRSGAMDVPENYNLYLQHCIKFGWVPVNVSCGNPYEAGMQISLNADIATDNNLVPRIKNKVFTSYNRAPRDHRLYIIGEILRRRLDKKSYFSAYINVNEDLAFQDETSDFSFLQYSLPKTWEKVAESLRVNYKRFPIKLNLKANHTASDYMNVTDNDINHYTESYFHLITETKFFHDPIKTDPILHHHGVALDCFFANEKTYKAIIGKVPFILVGLTGSLAALKSRGYKTFHPYIDESYDLIYDDEDRLEAVMNEVTRLSKFKKEEWLEWQENIIPILQHNYNIIKSRSYLG